MSQTASTNRLWLIIGSSTGFGRALAEAAIEGVSEAVRGEVAPFGIKVTVVEPGSFRTDFIGRSLNRAENSKETTTVMREGLAIAP